MLHITSFKQVSILVSFCDWQNNCISQTNVAAIVSSIANGKFLLWQNEHNFAL